MADLSAYLGVFGKGLDVTLILTVIIVCVVGIIAFLVIRRLRENKYYDLLVEITPVFSIKDYISEDNKEVERKGLFKKKEIVTTKGKVQTFNSYFVVGAYLFNNKDGTYYIKLRDGAKTEIQGIPYVNPETKQPFFKQIEFGKLKRYIHLVRYNPMDYKPVMTDFDIEQVKEMKHTFDSEGTYMASKTQKEIREKYLKGNKFAQFLPWIIVAGVGLLFIIGIYLSGKWIGDFTDQIGAYTSQMSELTKALMSTVK